jgi:hypothetical protein
MTVCLFTFRAKHKQEAGAMDMKRVALMFVLAGFVLVVSQALWAKDDVIYFREPGKKRDEKFEGKIEQESPAGIKVKPAKGEVKDIPALQIVQIEYGAAVDVPGVSVVDFRGPDNKLIQALAETKPDKRADLLRTALMGYQTLDSKDEMRRLVPVHRYLQFRIGQTLYYLAGEDASRRDAAIVALTEYKSRFADGWEIVLALQLLASLQEDKGDIEAAGQTLAALGAIPGISARMKLQSQLKGARLMMTARKFADAEKKLNQVASALPAADPQRAMVDVYLIQSQIAQKGKLDGIDMKLHQLLGTVKDGGLRAAAHNSLGDYYRAKDDLAQAFWEYCKVDMLYSQDKEEHAKALYYLSQLFVNPRNDRLRADEALERLKSPQFDGTLYQRQAKSEKK